MNFLGHKQCPRHCRTNVLASHDRAFMTQRQRVNDIRDDYSYIHMASVMILAGYAQPPDYAASDQERGQY